jgi:diacylglycerol kinase family enzyme
MPAPASVTVLLNAASGKAASTTEAGIIALFLAVGIDAQVVSLDHGRSPADAARAAMSRTGVVVAAGGDGTVSGVAGALAGTPATLGVLPLGTLNHFAKDLHIPLELDKAVATIAGGRIASVDAAQVNDRVFVNNSSIGVYPNIIETREALRRDGHRKWPAMGLAMVKMLRHYRGLVVRIAVEGRESVWQTPFVFVGNNEYTIEGWQLGGRTTIDAARLWMYLTPRVHARQLPMLLVRALLGRPSAAATFEIVAAPDLRVDTVHNRRIRVALDGEVIWMTTPLHYRSRPGALRVLVPPA